MVQVPEICQTVTRLDALSCMTDTALLRIAHAILECYRRSMDISRGGASQINTEITPERWIADILESLVEESDRRMVADMAIQDEAWTLVGCRKQVVHYVETTRKGQLKEDIDSRIRKAVRDRNDKMVNDLLIEKQRQAVKREKRKMELINRQ
jgi:hypothetical protein